MRLANSSQNCTVRLPECHSKQGQTQQNFGGPHAVLSFPPYGEFARYYNDLVAPLELPPTAWKPNLPPSDRYASWIEWREETLSVINRVLWPQWDATGCRWISPDLDAMLSLTNRG